ncbi:YqkE family protein [Bacillus sp. NPDC077027]|uniref:YqkE family protein n=1 Tax=Bacillus sp. NPDC077027 TaxID=3390548 RepID=UPI003CFFBFC8
MKKTNQDHAKLKDGLDEDLKSKLLHMKQELTEETEKKEEAKRKEAIQRQKEREKNKSFAELLDESKLDWTKYKH